MRFTIRDLLWLTVVVALGLGLWIDHSRLVAVRDHASLLRDNLNLARLWYGPQWKEPVAQPRILEEVTWDLADQPIP